VDDDLYALARLGDMSKEAVAFRVRAARESIQPRVSQKDMATRVGATNTTYGNWETGVAYVSLGAMLYLYRSHRIDFNFVLHGNLDQLPHDVREALIAAMRRVRTRLDQSPRSNS
jgi:DNA-binding XRE family transcriptional regulator